MAKDIKFNIRLNIDGRNVVVQASQSVKELQRNLMAARTGSQRLGDALIRFNQVARVYTNISDSLSTLSGVMGGYIAKANSATEVQTKLTTIMRQRMGATEADTAAINDSVAAQTKLGIVSGTVQKSGLQQLATFASQRQTLQTLLPAMNNLLAQQKGLNATSEDAVGVANLMGKALMGNVGALTRVGITLSDHQKELIKTGDEYTRASTLAQAITDNVGNMNAELAKTDAGQVKKTQMAFAGIEVAIGKAIAPFQGLMNQMAQVGLALGGIGQLRAAIMGLSRAIGLTSIATAAWNARSVMTTAMANAVTAAFNGAAIGATTLKWALRGLLTSTIIGAAITGLSIGLEKLVEHFAKSSDASEKFGQQMERTGNSFDQQRQQALAPVLTKYQELQEKWKSLKSVHEKNKFIKDNQDAFKQLGVGIDGVSQAENFFVNNTKSVQDAMYARAEAAAAAAMAEQEMQKALELEDKVSKDRQRDKRNYKNQHHTGKTGEDLAVDALVDNGGIKVTSKATQADERALNASRQRVRNLNKRSASAAARANKGLRPYQSRTGAGAEGGSARNSGGGHTTNTNTDADKKALKKSLDWYDQQMSALRKKIYATNNESTAESLQKQYKALEGKSKALKVKIGLEQPEQKEVKSYVEQLQDKLRDAQKQMDNATTVEARVAASANIANIQKQIDIATKGELTIEADVEPAYITKGSEADKIQSYRNAQNKASNLQGLYDAGIISKDEAKKRIDDINKELGKLGKGIKPVKLELETSAIDKAKESIQSLGQQWGGTGSQIGNSVVDVVNAFRSVAAASKEAKKQGDGTGDSFNAVAGYAAAGAAGLSALGSSLQQIGGNGAAAKAGAVMAAIGQIVLGFATYTAESAKLGPWGWVAAIASGLGIVASTISTLKGYQGGGVLEGKYSSGDKLLFRGNAGEAVVNRRQQNRLLAIADGQLTPRINMPSVNKVNTAFSRPSVMSAGDIGGDVRFIIDGDKLIGVIANKSRTMAKTGKRTKIIL